LGSLAEFERGLIREQVKAGLAAAKKKGIGQDYQSTHLSDFTGLRLSIALAGMSCWRAEASAIDDDEICRRFSRK